MNYGLFSVGDNSSRYDLADSPLPFGLPPNAVYTRNSQFGTKRTITIFTGYLSTTTTSFTVPASNAAAWNNIVSIWHIDGRVYETTTSTTTITFDTGYEKTIVLELREDQAASSFNTIGISPFGAFPAGTTGRFWNIDKIKLIGFSTSVNLTVGTPFPNLGDSSNDSLTQLQISSGGFTGIVPDPTKYNSLQTYLINNNNFDRGQSFPDISGLTTLTQVTLTGIFLTGNLPDLTNLNSLTSFVANGNSIGGAISFPTSAPITQYNVNTNRIGGAIPSLFGLTSLVTVNISSNIISGYTGLTMPSSLTNFNANTNSLTQSSVDAILNGFYVLIGAGLSSSGTINLAGTGNATASATGTTYKNALVAAGWTVTTN